MSPDAERTCPACGETVAAPAAVKCPSCRADLPEPTEHLRAVPTPDLPAGPVAAGASTVQPVAPRTRGRWGTVLTAVLCVVLAGATGFLLLDDDTEPSGPRSAVAPAARVPGAGEVAGTARSEELAQILAAASANAITVLSYNYRTLGSDARRAHAVSTDAFTAEYDAVMQQTAPKARKNRLTLRATVPAGSLVSWEGDRATALLFVDVATTSGNSPGRQVNKNRVLMTMTRQDGSWIVSQIEAF